jgi:hypothetical protein
MERGKKKDGGRVKWREREKTARHVFLLFLSGWRGKVDAPRLADPFDAIDAFLGVVPWAGNSMNYSSRDLNWGLDSGIYCDLTCGVLVA